MRRDSGRGSFLPVERRRGIRILTLKNAGWLLLALVVLFVAVSLYHETRQPKAGEPGELYEKRRR